MSIPLLSSRLPHFPDPEAALTEPDGLLAAGGSLDVDWLLTAYVNGIFPWFNDDAGPILWWSPDPRGILVPDEFRVSRSLRKRLRNGGFRLSADTCFDAVIERCSAPRRFGGEFVDGTWITPRMQRAYRALHEAGYAHSIEAWVDGELAGGLYGVSTGRLFFGESMFTRVSDASKVALFGLCRQLGRWGFPVVDCQMVNAHLDTLGLRSCPRSQFLSLVRAHARSATRRGTWELDSDIAALTVS